MTYSSRTFQKAKNVVWKEGECSYVKPIGTPYTY